ncbi:hypothetical protein LCGC14_2699510, partial [marine sediment metagenome]
YSALDFDVNAPQGKLTRFTNLDGRSTTLFYKKGQLARLEQTGGKVIDFAYDQAGRLAQLRTPAGADLDAHNGIDSSRRYAISYFVDGRVKSITTPAPLPGEPRLSHHYRYGNGTTTVTEQFAGRSQALSTVTFDARWRTLSETDLLSDYSRSYQWAAEGDRITSVIDSDDLQQTVQFDAYGRITDRYGPALLSQFDSQGLPTDSSVPASHTTYDEGLQPLVVRAWNQPGFAGVPAAIGTSNISMDPSALDGFSAASDDGWSAIVSTVITATDSGDLTIEARFNNHPDNQTTLIASGNVDVINPYTLTVKNVSPGDIIPITVLIDSADSQTTGTLRLRVKPEGSSQWTDLSDSMLSAGLGRTTSQSGNEQLSSQSAPQTLLSTMAYENPIKGTPLSTTLDPNGLALTSQLQYGNEPYGRVTGQTLPSGMSSRFTYW